MKILLFAFFILQSSFFISKAYAETISLAVDPPIFQINVTPPADILSPLTIENRGESTQTLKVSFKPFVPSDREDGLIRYVKGEMKVDAKLLDDSGQTVNEFQLSPKEKKKLTLSINVPSDSPSSDYYFSIIFLGSQSSKVDTSSSESVTGIASNVLLSVGNEPAKGDINEFSVPLFLEKGPVLFTIRVKNTSNHFITPKGEILVKNIFGQVVGRVDLAQVNLLAGSVRNVPSQDFFDEGKNLPDNLAAYWPQDFLLGPYKATLSIALSDTGPLFKRSVFFFAFPAKISIAVILGTLLLTYITIKVRSRV